MNLALEMLTQSEYNGYCSGLGIPLDNTPDAELGRRRWPKFYAAIVNGQISTDLESTAASVGRDSALAYPNLQGIISHYQDENLVVICAHPIGKWKLSISERRTMDEKDKYIEELDGLQDFSKLVVRAAEKSKAGAANHISRKDKDTFLFFRTENGWVLRKVNIQHRNFDFYNFGKCDHAVKNDNVSLVNALYVGVG